MINKMSELIVVEQLPIIRERLEEIKAGIEEKISTALALECNESTVRSIKAVRAELNKDFAELEDRRKVVKNSVMEPYEKFNGIYKECVSDVFRQADAELKRRIAEVEDEVKSGKHKEVQAYFEEYRESKHIDFVTFEQAGIKIGLSSSMKSLKEAAKAFIDRIADDLNLINTQECREEILVEYKETLNVSASITSVALRHKAIQAEQIRLDETQREQEAIRRSEEKVESVMQALAPPKEVEQEPEMFRLVFTVIATKEKLRALKQFLTDGGYQYE